jgi:hypothetical protein
MALADSRMYERRGLTGLRLVWLHRNDLLECQIMPTIIPAALACLLGAAFGWVILFVASIGVGYTH